MANPRQAFPAPPQFYKLFAPSKDKEDGSFEGPPPPPPVTGDYQVFGEIFEASAGIPKIAVQQLFSDSEIDFKNDLLALNREVMFCYMKLIDTIVVNPGAYARHLENLGVILRNIHQLLNLMRLKQAPATLEHMLMSNVEEQKQALIELQEQKHQAKLALQSASAAMKSAAAMAQDSHENDIQTSK